MKNKKTLTLLAIFTVILAAMAASAGILSSEGPGNFIYESIRGLQVEIYGQGIYRHMSADVAIQGIAQDYVTLFLAAPLLILFVWHYRQNNRRARFLLAGTFGYFFVTYLFYTAMGMYNAFFLVYVALAGLSLFGLLNTLLPIEIEKLPGLFSNHPPTKLTGGFLMFNASMIALMWLGVVVPPLLDGSLYPEQLQHYTTLIVQGFDLGLLLPLAFVSGWLLFKKHPMGYLAGSTYIVFLSFIMTALTAKIIAMALHEVNVMPAIIIIPLFNVVAIVCAWGMIRSIAKA